MKQIRQFFQDKVFLLFTCAGVALNAALWVATTARAVPQAQQVSLHYSIYFGIDLLGPWWYIFFFPAFALVVLVANTFLAMVWFPHEKLAAQLLVVAAVLTQLLFGLLIFLLAQQL